jgi:lysophospholipase L1-like esterase
VSKSIAEKSLLLLVAVIVSLLVSEGTLRLIGYRYSPLKIVRKSTTERDDRYQEAFRSSEFVFDPYLIWRPREGVSPFNAAGYPGLLVSSEKEPGSYRIVAVGDSNTLGHPELEGSSWPLSLQSLDGRLSVVNGGVVGYSSFQGVRRLRETLRLNPDMVLVSFGANDAHPVHLSDADYARDMAWRERLWKAGAFLRTFQLIVDTLDRVTVLAHRRQPIVHRVELLDYRANLEEMVQMARKSGARPIFLTRPFRGSSDDPMSWKAAAPAYNAATREVAKQDGVPLVDVYDFFRDREDLFEDESHFNAKGHGIAAAYIYTEIQGFLPPRGIPTQRSSSTDH